VVYLSLPSWLDGATLDFLGSASLEQSPQALQMFFKYTLQDVFELEALLARGRRWSARSIRVMVLRWISSATGWLWLLRWIQGNREFKCSGQRP
jgi:hypothetical protein